MNIHWDDWYWSWNSNTLATWCDELTHLKRAWCWERLKAGGERDNRGWDGWMASLSQWTWVWVNSGNWWWIGMPGMLQSMGLQRVGHDWATELNWLKGNQSWISIGRTNADDEGPILWLLDAKRWLIGRDHYAGKEWGQEAKGVRWLDASLTQWTWVWANSWI